MNNITKEMLLKHKFWVLIGVTAVLTLAGLGYIQIYGSDDAQKTAGKYKGEITGAKGLRASHNQESIEFWQDQVKAAKAQEAKVWKAAYLAQKDLFTWSREVEKKFDFEHGNFAHEIKVFKKTDEKNWPEDRTDLEPGQLCLAHGELVDVEENRALVRVRKKGPVWFYRAKRSMLIADGEGEPKKEYRSADELLRQKGSLVAITYQVGRYFGDELLDKEEAEFADSYYPLIHEILETVDPVRKNGKGVVQLNNWPYLNDKLPEESDRVRFIRFMNREREGKKGWDKANPLWKEAWMAMEDIWIQREIYQIIRDVNDEISVFKPVGFVFNAKEKGETRDKPYKFSNGAFEITVELKSKTNVLKFEIKNLLKRKQKVDRIKFRVIMHDRDKKPRYKDDEDERPEFEISADPLMPAGDPRGGDSYRKDFEVQSNEAGRTGIYGVQQVLTWETAAIKRIDHISIGSVDGDDISLSNRAFENPLRPFDERDVEKADAGGDGGGGGGPPGGGGKMEFGGGKGFGIGGGGGGATKNTKELPHGYWTNRYIDVTDPSRRIPVAIALIVEQDHVNRVLTHFNNSKLRFLQTQVLLNHYSTSLQPGGQEKKEGGPGPGGKDPKFGGLGGGFGVPPGGPMGGGPMGSGSGQPSTAGGSNDVETNFELVIYGNMTIYHRFPSRPVAEKKQ